MLRLAADDNDGGAERLEALGVWAPVSRGSGLAMRSGEIVTSRWLAGGAFRLYSHATETPFQSRFGGDVWKPTMSGLREPKEVRIARVLVSANLRGSTSKDNC